MDDHSARVRNKVIIRFITGIIGIAALLFLPAGSFLYWQGGALYGRHFCSADSCSLVFPEKQLWTP
jgi:hypothetical protein